MKLTRMRYKKGEDKKALSKKNKTPKMPPVGYGKQERLKTNSSSYEKHQAKDVYLVKLFPLTLAFVHNLIKVTQV